MTELVNKNPENLEAKQAGKAPESAQMSPDAMVERVRGGVDRLNSLNEKLESLGKRPPVQQTATSVKTTARARGSKKVVVNQRYFSRSYAKVNRQIRKNIYQAVEMLRLVRDEVFKNTDNRLRTRAFKAVTAVSAFFSL